VNDKRTWAKSMTPLKKGLLAAMFTGTCALIIGGNYDEGDVRYKRLTQEAMTAFQKQGFTPVTAVPVSFTQATFSAPARFCYALKKTSGDQKNYEGCADFARHASQIYIRPL
jgi:hypothetical protein